MIVFIWTRSGILVPIFFFLSAWLIGYAYDDTTMKNGSYMGFVFLSTCILIFLQAFIIKANNSAPVEEGSEAWPQHPKPKTRHTFFYIPVFYWGLLAAGLCIYFFVSGGIGNPKKYSKKSYDNNEVNPSQKEDNAPKRMINFLNPTDDTLYCYVGDTKGEDRKKKVEPNRYLSIEVEPGEYLLGAFDLDNNLTFTHEEKFEKDDSKYHRVEEKDGDVFYYRIVAPPTPDKTDYDEAWYIMDGKKQLVMIDVTDICFAGRKEKDITDINWTDHIVELYDPGDLIEPMSGVKTEADYFVLSLGEDIPTRIKSGKRMYWMTSFSGGKKITDQLIEERIKTKIFG